MLTAAEAPADRLARLEEEIERLQARVRAAEDRLPRNAATFCVLSGEYERVMAALMLAHMAAALEMEVTMFFTFWGVQAIRGKRRYGGKSVIEKALSAMLAGGIGGLSSGKLNFAGAGPVLFERLMREKNIASPAELLEGIESSGIRLVACTTSMEVFGIGPDELLPGVACCGASQFLEIASRSRVTLLL